MGRDRKNEARTEHFTMMVRNMMQTPAWRALSPSAQALYPWIRMEWRGKEANNNGSLRLSVRQAAECLGCSRNTAAKSFIELQAKGFAVVTEGACLGTAGEAKSPAYELTEIPLPKQAAGRKLYQSWREGGDFPVMKTLINNPTGKGGNLKPCPKIDDSPVPNIVTFRKSLSQKT